MKVFLEEISIRIGRLSKDCPPQMQVGMTQATGGMNRTERQRESKRALYPRGGVCLLLPSDVRAPGSQTCTPRLNHAASLPGSPACRQQTLPHMCRFL